MFEEVIGKRASVKPLPVVGQAGARAETRAFQEQVRRLLTLVA